MFELARIMGTSAKMIEQHYGTLIDTAHDAILNRLEAAAPVEGFPSTASQAAFLSNRGRRIETQPAPRLPQAWDAMCPRRTRPPRQAR